MNKALIFIANEYQDQEVISIVDFLVCHNFEVDVSYSGDQTQIKGKYGIPLSKIRCDYLAPSNFYNVFQGGVRTPYHDLYYIPGGWAPEIMRMDYNVLEILKRANEYNKIITAQCHGPLVLISAGLTKGRLITGYTAIKDDIINSGATYVDFPVVRDMNIITSPHYKYNPEFFREILRCFPN